MNIHQGLTSGLIKESAIYPEAERRVRVALRRISVQEDAVYPWRLGVHLQQNAERRKNTEHTYASL